MSDPNRINSQTSELSQSTDQIAAKRLISFADYFKVVICSFSTLRNGAEIIV
jgi:hypothetical protein